MKTTIVIIGLLAALFWSQVTLAQGTQAVTGRVYDEASGAPLAGVVINLLHVLPAAGAVSDTDGRYRFTVPIGRHAFKATYMGYESRTLNDIIVTAGKEVVLNINMQEAIHKLSEVTVVYNAAKDKTRTNNDMAQVSARSFNVEETKRYAGSIGDPSRMAANFAGVVSGNDANNDIVIRGNSPNGLLWQMEGINIPGPNHYGSLTGTGGPISMINNNNIDKSDFLTSAFPAQYGNATSGVFDIRLREGNKDKHEFIAQMGFNGFELGAEGPLGKNKKTTFLVNYRYSTLGVFQKLGISFGTGAATPYYQDINYKITSQLSRKAKLTLFGFAGASKIDFFGKDVDTTKTELYDGNPYANDRNNYGTSATGLAYEYRFNDKTLSRFTVGYSGTYEKYETDSISNIDRSEYPNYRTRLTSGKISANWMLKYKLSAQDNFETGVTIDETRFDLLNTAMRPGAATQVYADKEGRSGLVQGYGQWKHRFNNKLSAVGGLHLQYMDLNGKFAAEPRLSVRYVMRPQQALSFGYGLHHQAQNLYTYFVATDGPTGTQLTNKNLGFTNSHHFVMGYDRNLTEHLRIKAETYYQVLAKAPVEQRLSSYSALNAGSFLGIADADSLVNKGSGYNYGLELTAERFFNHGFYFLVTTSLFESKYNGSDGVTRNTAFNTNYVFNALAGKEFKVGSRGNTLAFNLKFTTVGGRYFTPINLEASRQEGNTVYYDDKAFTDKQPAYLRADMKIAYRKEYRKSTLELAIDLQNFTNHQNIFSRYYDSRTGKIVTGYQQSFFPIPMIRYTF